MSKRRKGPRPTAGTEQKRTRPQDTYIPRPFEGLADEGEWIALRELVPAATTPVRLSPELSEQYGDRPVTFATVLPLAAPALARADGRVLVAVQRHADSGDPARDLAAALLCALDTPGGKPVEVPALPGPGPRLHDVLADGPLDVTVHPDFSFWLDGDATDDPDVKASMERADAHAFPTVRLAAARSAYWCRVGGQAHVRWVLADDEDEVLEALARISAAGALPLGEGTRFAGMLRAYGRLMPVWDLPSEAEAGEWEAPLAALAERYAQARAQTEPLSPAERRARQGLLGRQKTLR